MEHPEAERRYLYHVYQFKSFLSAAFHCQENKSTGSHIGKIWTTFFLAETAEEKGIFSGTFAGNCFLDDLFTVCMGYRGIRELPGDG